MCTRLRCQIELSRSYQRSLHRPKNLLHEAANPYDIISHTTPRQIQVHKYPIGLINYTQTPIEVISNNPASITMPSELTKKEAQARQVQQQAASQGARDVETQEHHAKASASGGLNLNIFGALSGALSSKSKKTTHTNADGSSTSIEDRHDKGAVVNVLSFHDKLTTM